VVDGRGALFIASPSSWDFGLSSALISISFFSFQFHFLFKVSANNNFSSILKVILPGGCFTPANCLPAWVLCLGGLERLRWVVSWEGWECHAFVCLTARLSWWGWRRAVCCPYGQLCLAYRTILPKLLGLDGEQWRFWAEISISWHICQALHIISLSSISLLLWCLTYISAALHYSLWVQCISLNAQQEPMLIKNQGPITA
jgi:hypothetical protein